MTDKQIIIDGIKTSKEDFIDNFSIELTNRNIFEREQIGDKYFEIILRKEQECEELTSKCSQLEVLKYALEDIRSLINNPKNCVADIIYYADKTAHDALQKINEVEDVENN